nr:phosphoribosylanthranilate isomerase [Pseudomonadota bacterium]
MSKVKICGIKREEDLLKALEYGADAIGFNFVKSSPRYIEPETAKKLSNLIPINVLKVGVFVDEPLEELFKITKIVN